MIATSTLVQTVPQLKRGLVWCLKCSAVQRVDSRECLDVGWPLCCGETMTIDSPKERVRRRYPDAYGAFLRSAGWLIRATYAGVRFSPLTERYDTEDEAWSQLALRLRDPQHLRLSA